MGTPDAPSVTGPASHGPASSRSRPIYPSTSTDSKNTASSSGSRITLSPPSQQKHEKQVPDTNDHGALGATKLVEQKQKEHHLGESSGEGGAVDEGEEKEKEKAEMGKKQIMEQTNNKDAPAVGGKGGPMGTEMGRKEDRLKGKL